MYYCDDILKKLGAKSFRKFNKKKKRVNLFATLKAKSSQLKKLFLNILILIELMDKV